MRFRRSASLKVNLHVEVDAAEPDGVDATVELRHDRSGRAQVPSGAATLDVHLATQELDDLVGVSRGRAERDADDVDHERSLPQRRTSRDPSAAKHRPGPAGRDAPAAKHRA